MTDQPKPSKEERGIRLIDLVLIHWGTFAIAGWVKNDQLVVILFTLLWNAGLVIKIFNDRDN